MSTVVAEAEITILSHLGRGIGGVNPAELYYSGTPADEGAPVLRRQQTLLADTRILAWRAPFDRAHAHPA